MIVFYQYLFWISLIAILFPYIVYPLLLKALAAGKAINAEIYDTVSMPTISILIAAHNEEAVIAEKLESIFKGNYPIEKLEIIIGSDCSTDGTDEIVSTISKKYPNLKLTVFTERTGKVRIINKLTSLAINPILVITDANVMFDKDTLVQLIKHFKNHAISLVDTNMLHKGLKKEGISYQENFYIKGEVSTKYNEGKLWGTMMGPFGGCYALRKEYFSPVPENFLVDDFYINMKVLEKGGKAITEVKALVYEDVSNELMEEFRRKIRIATGSFQNLFAFKHLLFRFNAVSFCFFSHKVLRWKGPIFFILIYISSFLLFNYNVLYHSAFFIESFFLALVPLDFLLKNIGVHIRPLRLLSHFFFTNLALFIGMLKALGGVRSSIWEPTLRNQ
ncbi:MAG TPA: glycosyltransferase [Bacteroidia bacterium]|nr:glycosyltransferase [Bacteroidia bacterium]